MRTTSSVEAINSVIQRSFPGQTNIFKFTDSLRMHEAIKSTDMYQLYSGDITSDQLERRRLGDASREEKIKRLTMQLKNDEITLIDFLKSMSVKDVLPSTGWFFL